MSYLVLARKYRPQTFSEVVGQEHVTRTLANAFTKDRVHHAFLFCGPRGVGKTTLARILGKALNCERGPTAEPCGVCSACETITNGSAVDYFEMDGASNRGIDSIRELTDAVRYQPAVLRKKVYVIDEVHMLTTEAFNALLKTLEEPPPHVCFVLATTEPHKVPNTILSRCQRYDFKLVPTPRLITHLTSTFDKEQLPIDPGAVSLIVRESGGSVRDALSLCDQVISYVGSGGITEAAVAEVLGVADRALTRRLVHALATGDTRVALETVDAAVERGVDEVQVARAIVRYLRDLAVVQVAPDADSLVEGSAEEHRDLVEQARALERSRVMQMFDRMIRACDDLGNTQQPRLVLDLALIDVSTLEPLIPLGDLIDRLGDLERKLGPGGGGRSSSSGGSSGGGRRQPPSDDRGGARMTGPPSTWLSESAADPGPPPDLDTRFAGPPGPSAPDRDASRPAPASGTGPSAPSTPPTAAPAPAAASPSASAASHVPEPARPEAAVPAQPEPAPAIPPSGPRNGTSARPRNGASGGPPNGASARPGAGGDPVRDRPPEPAAEPPFTHTRTAADPVAAAPPRAHGSSTDALGEWEAVLAALAAARKMKLSGFYEHARILSWDDSAIEVGFASDLGALAEMALDTENMQAMKEFLRHHYGHPIGFSARMLTADESHSPEPTHSVIEARRHDAEQERQKREAEARAHPVIRAIIDTFGGTIEEIKTHV